MQHGGHDARIEAAARTDSETRAPADDPARRTRRTVIVTGGTRRLGRVICEALAAIGHDIVATYSEAALEGGDELAGFRAAVAAHHGIECVTVRADLRDPGPDVLARIFEACPSPLFGLVNNSALFEWDSIGSLQREQVEQIMSVNLVAPMLLTAEFTRRLPAASDAGSRPRGIVLTVLDQKIYNPYPDHLTYTVCKAALGMLVAMCAREPDTGIRFYGLAPGLTLPAPGQSQADFEAAQKTVPLQRSPTPDDIRRCVAFLFGCSASNGFVLVIDGGASLTGRERDFLFAGSDPPDTAGRA